MYELPKNYQLWIGKSCGVLLGAITQRFDIVVEFEFTAFLW